VNRKGNVALNENFESKTLSDPPVLHHWEQPIELPPTREA
jgi:hypothetical protein